jgi:hypothetical protein
MADNKIRVLKVGKAWSGSGFVPLVRLKGKWLKALGYDVDARFEIVFDFDNCNSLLLKKVETPLVEREVLPF